MRRFGYYIRICESEKSYSQNDLCNEWFYSKQTINSAIANLVKSGYVVLVPVPNSRNRKIIELTEEGKKFCDKSVNLIIHAERQSFVGFSNEEREQCLFLYQKNISLLRASFEKLLKEKS